MSKIAFAYAIATVRLCVIGIALCIAAPASFAEAEPVAASPRTETKAVEAQKAAADARKSAAEAQTAANTAALAAGDALKGNFDCHLVRNKNQIGVFDSFGAVVRTSKIDDRPNGAAGGVYIGDRVDCNFGDTSFSPFSFGGFLIQGAAASRNNGGDLQGGIGIVLVPISFLENTIQIGYGWNTALGGHLYFGFSLGHLFNQIAKKQIPKSHDERIEPAQSHCSVLPARLRKL